MSGKDVIERLALKYALANAVKFGGRAEVKPVISKVVSEQPELRKRIRDVVNVVAEVVARVNSMSIEEQRSMLKTVWPEWGEAGKREEGKKGLPPLPNVDKYDIVVTRFAPNPDGPLHLGSARPVILSHEYARMYNGRFILRFEDTDPRIKVPLLHLDEDEERPYDYIRRDLAWLGAEWDEEYIQSDRIQIYYDVAEKLIEKGGAYVCTCSRERFKALRDRGEPCPHRDMSVEQNLRLWDKMLSGGFREGEAVLRVKTDLAHPDPSVRDWVGFRIVDPDIHPHPRPEIAERRYWVWPTYNFAVTVDDHLMGVTHILRAKEHIANTVKQSFLYRHMGWDIPEAIHFGRMKFKGLVLSKSKIRKGVAEGVFSGWDDPRLGTLRALRRRGISPQAIRDLILNVGVKPVGVTVDWKNLAAYNKRYVEPKADRYMFVRVVDRPLVVDIKADGELVATIPYHPSHPERGSREIRLRVPEVILDEGDRKRVSQVGAEFRLLGLTNLRVVSLTGDKVHAIDIGGGVEYAKSRGLPIIQWVPVESKVEVRVVRPEGIDRGWGESALRSLGVDSVVQFIRYGFARLDSIGDPLVFYFSHN